MALPPDFSEKPLGVVRESFLQSDNHKRNIGDRTLFSSKIPVGIDKQGNGIDCPKSKGTLHIPDLSQLGC